MNKDYLIKTLNNDKGEPTLKVLPSVSVECVKQDMKLMVLVQRLQQRVNSLHLALYFTVHIAFLE